MIKTKQIGKHSKDCYAIKQFNDGVWDTPWAFLEEAVYLDKSGGKRGGICRWWIAPCNCRGCKAVLMVREEDIFKAIHTEGGQINARHFNVQKRRLPQKKNNATGI